MLDWFYIYDRFDSTGVNYNVTFETAKVYEHPDWVFNFISQNVTWNLEDSTIANSSVSAGDMTQDAHDQSKHAFNSVISNTSATDNSNMGPPFKT